METKMQEIKESIFNGYYIGKDPICPVLTCGPISIVRRIPKNDSKIPLDLILKGQGDARKRKILQSNSYIVIKTILYGIQYETYLFFHSTILHETSDRN